MKNIKAMGLMSQVAKGLLNHSGSSTAAQLGDRSKYVGLSDIGKGAECMRAAVANKVFGSRHPTSDDVGVWYRDEAFDEVMEALRKQLILQRGHWFEAGIEQAFEANGMKFFSQLEIDAGFDEKIVPVFSGIASAYGVLTEDEKETGVLLLDMGAGTCEYLAVCNMGILVSGVLPIGFEHLANDLSLGLDLHISDCRKLLQEETIIKHVQGHKTFIEIKTSLGSIRKIPLTSFETIINLRLRETFQIIHNKLATQNALQNLNSGGVLTGGGALFPQTVVLFSEVFNFPVRIGKPFSSGTTGISGIENPQHATIWGALKFAEELGQIINSRQKSSISRKALDIADNAFSYLLCSISNIFKAVKF